MKTHLISLGLALIAANSSTSAQAAAEDKPAIAIYFAGLEQQLSDPSDQGLLRVISYLDERIMELAEEFDQEVPPKSVVDLGLELVRSPMSLRIGLGDLSQGLGPNVVWAQLDVKAKSPEQAAKLGQSIEDLLGLLPFPLQEQADRPGIKLIDLGNGMGVQLGARRMADGTGTYFIAWGEPRVADMNLADYGMPAGSLPMFALGVDLAPLQPAIEIGLSMAGEQAAEARKVLEAYNVLGEDAWSLTLATGVKDERLGSHMRMKKWLPMAKSLNQYADQRLTEKDFSMIPVDARLANLQIQKLSGALENIRNFAPQNMDADQIIAMVEEFLGIDLGDDFFDTFGNVTGFYTSESSGGGGLFSMIGFVAIEDEARLRQTMGQMSARYLGLARGRARFSKWNHDGVECTTINTPGLPVPLELSLGFTHGYLFMALTRGALVAALDNAHRGDAGILRMASVQAELTHPVEDTILFSYANSRMMVRDGYGPVSLFYSALANAALSPSDPSRDLGMIMPSYAEMARRATPAIALGWVEGDDLIVEGRTSSSATANFVSLAGNPVMSAMLPFLALSLGTGVFASNKQNEIQSITSALVSANQPDYGHIASDFAMLNAGIELYKVDHDGQPPANLEALLMDANGEPYIWMEQLPIDPWGHGYHYTAVSVDGQLVWQVKSLGGDGLEGGMGEDADIDQRVLEEAGH